MTHSTHKKAKVTLIYNKIKESLIHLFIYLANIPIDRSKFVNYKFTIFSFMQFYTVLLTKIYLKIPLLCLLFTLLLFFIIFLLLELNYKFTKGLVKIKFTIYIKYNLLTLFVLFLDLQYSFNLSMISIISSDAFIESFTRRGCRVFLSEVILGVFLRYRRNKGSSFIFGCFVLFYFSWVFYFYNLLFLFQEIFLIFLFYFSLFITSSHRSILSPILSVIVNTSFLMYFFTGLDLFSYGVLVIVNDDL